MVKRTVSMPIPKERYLLLAYNNDYPHGVTEDIKFGYDSFKQYAERSKEVDHIFDTYEIMDTQERTVTRFSSLREIYEYLYEKNRVK